MAAFRFLTTEEQETIKQAVAKAEMNTSGEIRLRLEPECSGDPLTRAIKVFELLNMHKTKDRNGILIYVAYEDRKMAIFGDEGIHSKVPADYWQSTLQKLQTAFAKGLYCEGLVQAISDVGHNLKNIFPYQLDDRNELDNDISHGQL